MGSGGVFLPKDLFLEILMCLPVKSLLRFKSVCKSWYALIKSSDFIHRHANMIDSKSKLGTFICQYHAPNIDASQFFTLSGESLELFEDLGKRPCFSKDDSDDRRGKMVASCHGIICIHDDKAKDIGLWNPATKQCRLLPKPLRNGNLHADFVGFGFDVENKDYKVLLVTSFKQQGWDQRRSLDCVRKVQIYSLSTDSWRWIDVDLATHCPNVDDYKQGLYLNGSYFISGVDYCYQDQKYQDVILSFDFHKEIFRKFLAPAGGDIPSSRLTQLYSVGEKPACTKCRDFMFFEVWVLNDYNKEEECWTKLYILRPLSDCSFGPFAFTRNGEFGFLMAEVFQLYNFSSDEIEERIFGEGVDVCNVDLYKESLVSISANAEGTKF